MSETEASLQFEQFQIQRILKAGAWQAERFADQVAGEILTFEVYSFTTPGLRYRVDLGALMDADGNEPNGWCSCINFETRCGPNFHRNGKHIVDYRQGNHKTCTRCRHIYLANRELSRRIKCRFMIR